MNWTSMRLTLVVIDQPANHTASCCLVCGEQRLLACAPFRCAMNEQSSCARSTNTSQQGGNTVEKLDMSVKMKAERSETLRAPGPEL